MRRGASTGTALYCKYCTVLYYTVLYPLYRILVFSLLEVDSTWLESEPCQARVARIYENCEVRCTK